MPGRFLGVFAACLLLPTMAVAQDLTARFWLAGSPKNVTGCIAFDPQFTLEHTLTIKDGKATLTSPGGINTSLTQVRPGVYEEDNELGGLQLKVVADINDKTLTVSDKYIGCWWTAKWQ
jgi:hypothetical protein